MIESRQLHLIATIYDGVTSNKLWPDLLQACADDVGAISCILASHNTINPKDFTITAYSNHFTSDMIYEYETQYAHYDRVAWASLQHMPAGSILPDEEVWPDPTAAEIRPYMDFCERRLGINKRVGYRLNNNVAWFEAVAFQFSLPARDMLSYDTKRSRVLVPHFAKAVELMRGFNALQARFNAVLGALDKFNVALILVRNNGQVVHWNAAADRLLESRDGIRMSREGYLRIDDAEVDKRAQDAITRVSATAKAQNNDAGFAFRLPKKSGGDGYLLEIAPLRDSEGEIDSGFRDALIMVIDPNNAPEVSLDGVAAFYGLTPAESEVVGLLMRGNLAVEIAERRNVSPETVKTQIKSILAKTGNRNRLDLIRTILNISLPIDR